MTDKAHKPPPGCMIRLLRYGVLMLLMGCVVVIIDAFKVNLPLGTPGSPRLGEQVGVIHVHTKASHDGGGDVDDVVAAARWADLSFVAITDHNMTLGTDMAGKDRNSILLIGGEETSTPDGHFLVLGVEPGWRDGVPKESTALLQAAGKAGGARFLTHPVGARKDWTKWDTDEYEGIEIWNGDAEWRNDNPFELLMAALTYTVNPELALVRITDRPVDNLELWDKLLEKRKVAGICGADAHASIPIAMGWHVGVPAYMRVFRLARQHVLLSNEGSETQPPRGADALVKAIANGRSYCALDGLSIAGGFVNRVEGEGRVAGPGQSVAWSPGATIRVSIPGASGRPLIKVFKDGVETFTARGWRLDADLSGPGRYRTEVWVRQPGLTGGQQWTPWILSNPIYVTAGANPQ